MKLYIKIDCKDRYEISGTIKNKTRKVEEEIFLLSQPANQRVKRRERC